MTDDLLPAGLAGLPTPWNLTSQTTRRAALTTGSRDAPMVLDRVLGELPALLAASPDDEETPASSATTSTSPRPGSPRRSRS